MEIGECVFNILDILRLGTYAGLPSGFQKYYRVQIFPKTPMKCQQKIPSIWHKTDKNTDTQEGES